MLLAPTFVALAGVVLGFATQVSSSPTTDRIPGILTESQMLTWLSTTDAELTYIGQPIPKQGGPSKLDGGNVLVVYCSNIVNDICSGPCTVYNGGTTCLRAPNTNCLIATANAVFCNVAACGQGGGICNQLAQCGYRLHDNFCYTPGTQSIQVPYV